ncbi:MAG TPA: permease prefix domain 2-containing transporter [Thermoanaerobaculia bacterium]|nr:permease prefix domain 2-containing transporter [Thermoanaerobaculia bacterium]
MNPPRWAESLLCFFLADRDRETISGDLLEQYREVALPRRGRSGANLWYVWQVASIVWLMIPHDRRVTNVRIGAFAGAAMSIGVVFTNVLFPSAETETPLIYAIGWGSVGVLFAVAGFLAWNRTERLGAAFNAGAVVALVSMASVMVTFAVVDNVFLDIVSRQPEKIFGLQHSGYRSMRAYINVGVLRGFLLALPILTLAGALCGAIGGVFARLFRQN